jgi:hypothetical protein
MPQSIPTSSSAGSEAGNTTPIKTHPIDPCKYIPLNNFPTFQLMIRSLRQIKLRFQTPMRAWCQGWLREVWWMQT